MKFRYLIIDEDGDIMGTNDADIASAYSDSDLVVDVKLGCFSDSGRPILEAEAPYEDEEGSE